MKVTQNIRFKGLIVKICRNKDLRDPSLRSVFRQRAPASLTPAKRLNLAPQIQVKGGFGVSSCSVGVPPALLPNNLSTTTESARLGRRDAGATLSWKTGTLVAAPLSGDSRTGAGSVSVTGITTVVMNPKPAFARNMRGGPSLGSKQRGTKQRPHLIGEARSEALCGVGSRRHGCGASKAEVRSEPERLTRLCGCRRFAPALTHPKRPNRRDCQDTKSH